MNRWGLILILLVSAARLRAEDAAPAETSDSREETNSDQEWESKGVIPQGGLTVSTQPVTPISIVPDRSTYDQGLEELAIAQDLLKKENMEAASDVALQAYDELVSVHMGRKNKKKRQKLREDRHQAATVYVDSSIAYIQEYVKKRGSSTRATEEGRARLGDLRDVSNNYPELTKKVTKAFQAYGVETSTPVITTPAVTASSPSVKS